MRTHTTSLVAVFVAASTLMLAGCTAPTSETASTSSPVPSVAKVTLHVGTDDDVDAPAAKEILQYADDVHRLSDGAITILGAWHSAGDTANWDQAVAQQVISGEVEMGLIPTRAWDMLGVTSLEPLNDPFLIQSDDLVKTIVTGPIAADLMAGLPDKGVTGISLFPEGLRHPFANAKPLLKPADYKGGTMRAATSAASTALYGAYGAKVTDNESDTVLQIGTDSSFLLGNEESTATGNVTFYPKVNGLVISSKVLAMLSQAQKDVLIQAAKDTQKWTFTHIADEKASAKVFCTAGGSITAASAEGLAALQAAAAPVGATLASHGTNQKVIDAISAAGGGKPAPDPVTACP
ncbi:hypothetical protein [Diaminobutyricibacter sp. McL0608]|uniref:hypothetical protein n=1 Tax=Leifsonia sp. McL0608 TaxID=3143537 RepID=UPI0031F2F952